MAEIHAIHQQWLKGRLSQEDALFSIGDVLDRERAHGGCGPEAVLTESTAA
jgi:hypothetical protein